MRRLRPFLTLLIGAAVLNVLVAWGCISWSPYTSSIMPSDKPTDNGYPPAVAGPYGQQGWWFSATGVGVWQSVPSGARGAEGQFLYWRGSHTPAYYRGGWPMLSVQSRVMFHDYRSRWDLPVSEIVRRGMQTTWLPLWLHALPERRLPLVPFWPGFAINTLAYFSVLLAGRYSYLRVAKRTPNQTLETNCRPATPLDAGRQFGRAAHALACVSGGSRSALRSTKNER
jgi:hypothetical protein